LLSRQWMFFAAGIALFAIAWSIGTRFATFGSVLLYSFTVGNLVSLGMGWLSPFYISRRFPFDWLAYLICLFGAAVPSSAFAVFAVMASYRAPLASFSSEFWSGGRLGILAVMIVGSIYHAYDRTRIKLESHNRELLRTLEIGETQSQLQIQELGKAREIQEGLLPKRIPQIRGYEVAGTWQPARVVGGDYFDVLKFGDRKIGLCIGDVVGQGVSAALLMANLQASVRALTAEDVSTGTLMEKLNNVICHNIAPDKFITFCYCKIDAAHSKLTYANAGHWAPVLLRKSGKAILLEEGGAPLGIFADRKFEEMEIQLESGDRLILYTDGVTEATNASGEEYTVPRLSALGTRWIALSASDLLEKIRSEVSSFCDGSFHDDVTLVVLAVK
jgi:sigma-B regulation protein RsbU (phosphoserine phosphatase)